MSGIGNVIWAPLTQREDETPYTCRLKVYWRTNRTWTKADVEAYHSAAPRLAEAARTSGKRFTCEDFALELLCTFASKRGLPVKLTDGVWEYRNMDIYDPDYHENYPQTPRGFISMVMVSFGAPDLQRDAQNTVRLTGPTELLPGDVLALAHDSKGQATGGRAHHIQVVTRKTDAQIDICQGNSNWEIHKPITWINRIFGRNSADPDQRAYAGMTPETGSFVRGSGAGGGWNYRNNDTGNVQTDFLRFFEPYRWNFEEFNH
ncbi:hypothetical protein AWB74_00696 [Caballeronia arvi]|uniref:Uncharacterized protein n=1 Tax=Caballeronia arvi TaxID=1777135 RepID=A0A158FIW8_9BURK|nr:hypothetical protein [Caballeronia arvi]SAL19808.1 hypothetical protein AWB74_00696 [Caballeronia arvi]